MPQVSVVMPVYNGAKYIGEAIQSLIAQTCSDWELIIIDDGSTDATAQIALSISDPRINFAQQPNAGAGAARNAGIARASGKYLAFLDADDLYLPTALESNIQFLDSNPEMGLVYSDGFYCDEKGKPFARLSDFRPSNVTGHVLETIVINPLLGASCSALMRLKSVRQQELWFDSDVKITEDWDFFIRFAQSEQFGYNAQPTCLYRWHGENSTLRNKDLKANVELVRLRVLRSTYFSTLLAGTRSTLFYQLFFDTFANEPRQQEEVIASLFFKTLPGHEQARLLRLVASHWLLKRWPTSNALNYLGQSIRIETPGIGNRMLWITASLSPTLARVGLTLRRCLGSFTLRRRCNSPLDLLSRKARKCIAEKDISVELCPDDI